MNLLRNMIVGNKEIRRNSKKRKQIQERRIKNLTLITSVISKNVMVKGEKRILNQ